MTKIKALVIEKVRTQKEIDVEFPVYVKDGDLDECSSWEDYYRIELEEDQTPIVYHIHVFKHYNREHPEYKVEKNIKRNWFSGNLDFAMGLGAYKCTMEEFEKAHEDLMEYLSAFIQQAL